MSHLDETRAIQTILGQREEIEALREGLAGAMRAFNPNIRDWYDGEGRRTFAEMVGDATRDLENDRRVSLALEKRTADLEGRIRKALAAISSVTSGRDPRYYTWVGTLHEIGRALDDPETPDEQRAKLLAVCKTLKCTLALIGGQWFISSIDGIPGPRDWGVYETPWQAVTAVRAIKERECDT